MDVLLRRFPLPYSRLNSRGTNRRQNTSGTDFNISGFDTILTSLQIMLDLFNNVFELIQIQEEELHSDRNMPSAVNLDPNNQFVHITPNSMADDQLQSLSSQRNQSLNESRQNSNDISKNEVLNRSDIASVTINRRISYNKAMKAIAMLNNEAMKRTEPIAPNFKIRNQSLDKTSKNEEFNRSSDNVLGTSNVLISNNNTINGNSMQNNEAINQDDDRLQSSSSQSSQFLEESEQNSNNVNKIKEHNRSGNDVPNTSIAYTMQNIEAGEQEWVIFDLYFELTLH